MEQKETDVKVPLISKIAYGMGDVGCNFSWMFVGNFLMIFYTDVFGIGMGAVAGLMLFSRFWDAINDPVIGGLSDKTHTRWGRYRPWLLIAAPLTAVVLMLTFWAHPDWPSNVKIVYMAITYCILVLGYTCVNIPYGTLCGAMTQNIEERAKINTFRWKWRRQERIPSDRDPVRMYLCGMPYLLFCKDKRGGRGAGKGKDLLEDPTVCRCEE